MPEFFLELFSEEIPARMQVRAGQDLLGLVGEALHSLGLSGGAVYVGPRRIAVAITIGDAVPEGRISERGPRTSAPEQALAGFLRKHGATKNMLNQEGDFWVLDRVVRGVAASELIASAMPALIRRFPWPKSMRWGGTSTLTWVRPLRRICCLLDGAVVPFDLRQGGDDGHGLVSSNLSEGHRFISPGTFAVTSADQWREELRARHVVVDFEIRCQKIESGIQKIEDELNCVAFYDPKLLQEVAGLVEWPVMLFGHIVPDFMTLPAEVLQVSMRVNQRYFAVRHKDGSAAPYFIFAANITAHDGGAAIIAGNERVLRARFADARYFWDLDRTTRLEDRVAALDGVTFHSKLGTQGARVRRLVSLATAIAPMVGADPALAARAALLAKADLTTGMVGEFPELQGVMGSYYARHDGEDAQVATAVRDHYLPKGAGDDVPTAPVAIAVALADKLDQLACFFAIGEKPTGSGDPFALRRAALGAIRIIREKGLRLRLGAVIQTAGLADPTELLDFLAERLRVQLRAEDAPHGVLAAVLALGLDDDFTRLLARTYAVAALLFTDDGANLLAAAKRAANILRIEGKKDGPHDGAVDPVLFAIPEEETLAAWLDSVTPAVQEAIADERFAEAMTELASLRPALDAFFASVTVNDENPDLRRNRLRLLSRVRAAMSLAADFSKIDG